MGCEDRRGGREASQGTYEGVTSAGFSPDGNHIVSGSYDNTIRIWDARTGEEVVKPLNGDTSSHGVISNSVSSSSASALPTLQPFLQSDLCFVHSDGWIRGCHQELILWVLPEWRDFVQWGRCILIIGQSRVLFDPSPFCSRIGMDKMYLKLLVE
jgi:hypothetical protein